MRRSIAFGTVLALLLLIPAAAQAAKPEQFKFDGASAYATWSEEGEESFTFTDVFLNVGTFTFGGDSFEDASFDVFIGEFGADTFTDLFGFSTLTPDQYELDAAGGTFSASVEADVELIGQECTFGPSPFPECVPLGPFFVTVVVEWDEAGGRMYPSTFVGRTHSPFGFDAFMSKSLSRATAATGEVSGELTMELGVSDQASISRETSSDRFRFTAT